MEKIILLLIIKVSIIMSNHLQKANMEIEKSIIIVNELSDEYIDKKKQIEEAYSEIIIQYIDAIKNDYYLDIHRTDEELFRKKFGPDFNQNLLLDLWVLDYNHYDFQVLYAIKDIDHNGIPELFIGSSNGIDKVNIYDIYTFNGIKAVNPFDELFSKNCDFGYRNCLYLYTDGILVELWRTGGFHYGWRFYQIAPDGYHIKLLDNISEYTKYEGEVYYYSNELPKQSSGYFNDKCEVSYERYLQIYEKYTSGSEDKISWNKICEMEDVNLEEQVELKEELERDIDYTMDILLKESHEEIRQINLKAFYEKKDKIKNAYEELIDTYTEAMKNYFYQELKERDMKSYEMQLKPYLSRQVMEDSALYKEECYDYCIYCSIEDIDENGIPELLIGASNGIDGLYFCDMLTFNGEKIIKLFDESDYVYGKKRELFLSSDGIFGFWLDKGEKGLKTEFYKLSSDGWHVEFIESLSYKVDDDSGQKVYYRNKNGEYQISHKLYSLILEEYQIRSGSDMSAIKKISNK